jgi:hypothetical protein
MGQGIKSTGGSAAQFGTFSDEKDLVWAICCPSIAASDSKRRQLSDSRMPTSPDGRIRHRQADSRPLVFEHPNADNLVKTAKFDECTDAIVEKMGN